MSVASDQCYYMNDAETPHCEDGEGDGEETLCFLIEGRECAPCGDAPASGESPEVAASEVALGSLELVELGCALKGAAPGSGAAPSEAVPAVFRLAKFSGVDELIRRARFAACGMSFSGVSLKALSENVR